MCPLQWPSQTRWPRRRLRKVERGVCLGVGSGVGYGVGTVVAIYNSVGGVVNVRIYGADA